MIAEEEEEERVDKDGPGKKRARLDSNRSKGKQVSSGRKEDEFEFPTTLENVAQATGLRLDDVAYTLVECGLAQWRRNVEVNLPSSGGINYDETGEEDEEVGDTNEGNDKGEKEEKEPVVELVITLEKIQDIIKQRRVREQPWLDRSFVLL